MDNIFIPMIIVAASLALGIVVTVWKFSDATRFPGWIVLMMFIPVVNVFGLILLIAVIGQSKPRIEIEEKNPRKGIIYTEAELKQFRSGYR